MRIIRLAAQNIKRLTAVDITPPSDVVTISGKNGQGKTSVLDSIWWLLAGAKNIQAQPIRRGAEKARIKASLGDNGVVEFIAERKFTKTGSTVSVTTGEGFTPPGGAQGVLDALLGELSFDPLKFANAEPKQQLAELLRVFPIAVNLDEIAEANKADYARRTDINRDAKAARVKAAAVVVPPNLPDDRIDESALLSELQKAGEFNAAIETRKARRADAAADIERLGIVASNARKEAADLRRRAEVAEAAANDADTKAADLTKKLDEAEPLPDPVDATAIRFKIDDAKAVNAAIDRREQRAKLEAEAEALEKQSQALTDAMAARERQKVEAVAAAKFPVDGLGFGDEGVTFNGVPFEQASASEQLRVSVAIGMAANPKLRVILIRDGSLLDDDAMAALAEMAHENEYQVWIERVASDDPVGIVIEDGAVKEPEA